MNLIKGRKLARGGLMGLGLVLALGLGNLGASSSSLSGVVGQTGDGMIRGCSAKLEPV